MSDLSDVRPIACLPDSRTSARSRYRQNPVWIQKTKSTPDFACLGFEWGRMRSRGGGLWLRRVSAEENSSRGMRTAAVDAHRNFGRGGSSCPARRAWIVESLLLLLVMLGCDAAPKAPSLAGIVAGGQVVDAHQVNHWVGCASASLATSRTARRPAVSICGDWGVSRCATLRLRGGDDGDGAKEHGGGKKRTKGARQVAINKRGSWSQGDDVGQSLDPQP